MGEGIFVATTRPWIDVDDGQGIFVATIRPWIDVDDGDVDLCLLSRWIQSMRDRG